MWLSDPIDIGVTRNTTTPLGFSFIDKVTDTPVNLTGTTMLCNIARADGDAFVYQFPLSIVDPVGGLANLYIDGSVFSSLEGPKEVVKLAFQVISTQSDGVKITALRGSILVYPGIN